MSVCTFFIKANDNPPNLEEIKTKISNGSIEEKIAAIKQLIKCLVNDDAYPSIIMHIITNIIPIQHKSNELRKAMLLYWQIIQKSKSPTDKSLKQEVFLACNSLRNDLIGHNEYLRGRTLRLVSRIMHKGVIEPLSTAITNNLQHKVAYVRRNAVICLYNIHMHFGTDIIGEIDDEIQQLLKTQTDLSTKRNAFILLNKANPTKAMQYLQSQIKNQAVDQIGDILQLAILKILKVKCKEEASQKPRLLKIVNDFQEKANESVKLECALTSTAISNSASTIKSSLNAYVNILSKTSEINVKKIILDKLEIICKNSNYLQDDLIQDLLKGLNTPSIQIKIKIINIIMTGLSIKTSQLIIYYLQKDTFTQQNSQIIPKILCLLELISYKFACLHHLVVKFIIDKLIKIQSFTIQSQLSLTNIFKLIFKNHKKVGDNQFISLLISSFEQIVSKQLITIVLNQLTIHISTIQQIQNTLDSLKNAIGALPLIKRKQQDDENTNQIEPLGLRYYLINDSILGGVFARCLSKMLYKIRKTQLFNKRGSQILLILCSLLRNYQKNLCFVDQAVIDQITVIIRKIVNPQHFIQNEDVLFQAIDNQVLDFTFNDKKVEMIEKNPQDLIHFRLLKKGQQANEFDYDDQQVNDILEQTVQKVDFMTKLRSIVQLTGAFDPLYAQAFIKVNKYDLFFQILLINNTKSNLLNIQIEFSSTVEILVLEKAQSVNLRPHQSVLLRTQIRFTNSQFGIIYGYVNYDNQAGLQQPFLITQQINIDYMQFIEPSDISETNFKIQWQKAQNEIVYETNIVQKQNRTFKDIIHIYENIIHAKLVGDINESENQYFLNCHLFGRSKLGENFYINLALFSGEQINLSITIRSKDKAVSDIIYKELLKKKFSQIQKSQQ